MHYYVFGILQMHFGKYGHQILKISLPLPFLLTNKNREEEVVNLINRVHFCSTDVIYMLGVKNLLFCEYLYI